MTANRVARQALDRALDEKDDLLLVYQPIHDARSGEVRAAEALLRQRRRSGEVREASIITAAAEKGPEIFLLDSLTMRTAFSDAARWMRKAPAVRLQVNLSPREFEEKDVTARLETLAAGTGIDLHRVALEITETTYIKRPEETVAALADLKRLGVGLWLDDFGTHHSSIEHLQKFPLDGIKIPRQFMKADRNSVAIARGLIAIAHEIGLTVIAEGVENREQLAFLLENQCDLIQGFLFSKPMELEDFEAWLTPSSEASTPPAHIRPAGDRGPSSPSS
jgi:EAL domain-containing protein (putative c-di-GMP-specific phosphodiesterase class I)